MRRAALRTQKRVESSCYFYYLNNHSIDEAYDGNADKNAYKFVRVSQQFHVDRLRIKYAVDQLPFGSVISGADHDGLHQIARVKP